MAFCHEEGRFIFSLGELIYKITVDSKEAIKGIGKTDDKMKKFGKGVDAVGDNLTLFVSGPLAAGVTAAVAMATSYETAANKFATAFKGAEEEAEIALKNLNENFLLSTTEATKLLANTGDLLKGFGATSDEALKLSESTQELAASLAAYNGVPVAQASEAITKALLGETEGMKLLGVSIKQTDIEQRLLEKGQADLTGQALLLAKAETTLELAQEQSTDAVASFAENSESAANQTNLLVNNVKDEVTELGMKLLPAYKEVLAGVIGLVEGFGDLDISVIAGIASFLGAAGALGTIIKVASGVITAIGTISGAWVVLAGVMAVSGVVGLATSAHIAQQEDLKEKYTELAEELDIAKIASQEFIESGVEGFDSVIKQSQAGKEAVQDFINTVDLVGGFLSRQNMDTSIEGMAFQVLQLSENLGLSVDKIISMGLASDQVSDEYKDQLQIMQDQNDVAIEYLELTGEASVHAAEETEFKKETTLQERILKKQAAEMNAILEARIAYQEKVHNSYLTTAAVVNGILDSQKTETQVIQDQIDVLNKHPWAKGELENKRLAAIEILQARQKQIADDEIKAAEEIYQKKLSNAYKIIETKRQENQIAQENADKEIQVEEDKQAAIQAANQSALVKYLDLMGQKELVLEYQKNAAIAAAEKEGQSTYAIELIYAEKKRLLEEEDRIAQDTAFEETAEKYKEQAQEILGVYNTMSGALSGILSQQVANADTELSNWQINNKTRIADNDSAIDAIAASNDEANSRMSNADKDATDEEKDLIQQGVDATLAANEVELADELEKKEIIEAEERELLENQYDMELEAFKTGKLLNVAETAMTGAQAAISAYGALAGIPVVGPALGIIAAAAVAAFTGKQIDLINKQAEPAKPQFAAGGIVTEETDAILGEAGNEAIIPLNDNTLSLIGQAIAESTEGTTSSGNSTGDVIINIPGFGQTVLKDGVQQLLNNRQLTVSQANIA